MKKTWIGCIVGAIIAAAVIAAVSTPVTAQSAPASREAVGVINMVTVFNECDQWNAIKQMLEKQVDARDAEAEKRKTEMQDKMAELNAYHPDTPDWKRCQEELAKLRVSAGVWAELEKNRVEQLRRYWIEKNYSDINQAVEDAAKKHGLGLVIVRDEIQWDEQDYNRLFAQIINRKVVYVDDKLDITNEVLRELNERFKVNGGVDALMKK